MIRKEDFTYLSKDGKTRIQGFEWAPAKNKFKGIVQIAHGMAEHIGRYDDFATSLAEEGYIVVGNDHLGHGKSVISEEHYGYFSQKDGILNLIEDMETLRRKTKSAFPELPYFFLGHSMGSFLVRKYISLYGANIQGAVLVGTGNQDKIQLSSGILLIKILKAIRGEFHRSRLVNYLVVGKNSIHFNRPSDASKSWISKNPENVREYKEDSMSGFLMTLNGYENLLKLVWQIKDKNEVGKIPKELPIMLLSGKEDPVGNFGRGVLSVYHQYQKQEIRDLGWKLYPKDRHEILNEEDKEVVYQDIVNWLNIHCV